MMQHFREIVRAHKLAEETGAEIRGVLSGVLTIGSYYSVAAVWLPEIIRQFQQMHPNIRIRMKQGGNLDMAKWLNERSVDCCFSAKPSPDAICDWMPLHDDEMLVWVNKNHPRAKEKSFPIADLEKEPFIITSPDHDTDIDRFLQAEHLSPDIRFSTADAYTTYCMVAAGLGISLDNSLMTEKWDGDVVTLPFDPPRTIALGISVPALREASPATRQFIRFLEESIKKL